MLHDRELAEELRTRWVSHLADIAGQFADAALEDDALANAIAFTEVDNSPGPSFDKPVVLALIRYFRQAGRIAEEMKNYLNMDSKATLDENGRPVFCCYYEGIE